MRSGTKDMFGPKTILNLQPRNFSQSTTTAVQSISCLQPKMGVVSSLTITRLFCGDIGLFCRVDGLFCKNIGLFCADVGLFGETLPTVCSLARALCPIGGLYLGLLKIIGLFCKRALQKRLIFCQKRPIF